MIIFAHQHQTSERNTITYKKIHLIRLARMK